MNSIDVRKFITGFLILSAIASSSAIFIGNFGSSGTSNPSSIKADKKTAAPAAPAAPQVPARAFVESVPERIAAPGNAGGEIGNASGPFALATSSPSNITDAVVSKLAEEMVRKNPEGPQVVDGNPSIEAPDVDALLAELGANEATLGFAAPDWERQAQAEMRRMNLIEDPGGVSMQNYQQELNGFFTKNFSPLEQIIEGGAAATDDSLQAAARNTLAEAQLIRVPAEAAAFHQSLIRLIVYERNTIGLMALAEEDPLKASLIMQSKNDGYLRAVENFQAQFFKVSEAYGPFFAENEHVSPRLAQFLGIRTAHAQWLTFSPVEFALDLLKFVGNTLLDFVRDRIIHKLVQQTIRWVQGGGKPQFVRDWRQFLTDTADILAGQVIQDIAPGFCKSFGPLLRFQLESTYLSNTPPITCTLEQVVDNVENFYDDFSQGGWTAYGEAILPSGNYFGQLFEASQIIELRRLADKEAAKSKVESGSGFASQEVCVKQGKSAYELCVEGETDPETKELCKQATSKERPCEKWEVTTPGQAIGQNLYNALGSPIQRIINAQDIRALTSALVNSALNKLTKLIAGKPDPKGLLGINPSTIGTATGGHDDGACKGLKGNALASCLATSACGELTGREKEECLKRWVDADCKNTPVVGTIGLEGTIGTSGGSSAGQGDLSASSIDVDGGGGGGGGGEGPGDGDGGGGGSANLSGTIRIPGTTCKPTFASVPGTTPPGGTDGENCNGGKPGPCNCTGRDSLAVSDFCFADNVMAAMDAVVAAWQANTSLDVGLVAGPVGNCPDPVCVKQGEENHAKFRAAVAAEVSKGGGLSASDKGEVEVTGACASGGAQTCGQAGCIGTPRTENYSPTTSNNTIRGIGRIGRAVCSVSP